jgi:diacylglycerol kinase family enzyme
MSSNATGIAEKTAAPLPTGREPARSGAAPRLVAIVNLAAGADRPADGLRDSLAKAFADHGISAEIEMLSGDEIDEGIRRALAAAKGGSLDAVVVGGGDGTIRTAAGVLSGTGVPLGILPLGTLNHFAKDLGLPLDLNHAAGVIAKVKARPVDLGEVNGEIFINNSSIGIYPYLVTDRDRRRSETGLSKWKAMTYALVRVFKRFPRRRIWVHAEGATTPYRTPCLFVGNNEYDMRFFSLGRRQALDEGKLHFYIAPPVNRWAFVWFALRAVFGNTARLGDLDTLAVSSAEIRSRASRIPVALDGEVRTLSTPLRYRSRPGALTVIVPAESASSSA